mgnify:CR=1 FL=1
MIRSKELENLLLDLYKSSIAGDLNFFQELILNDDDVLTIGTDPHEYWLGYSTIIEARSKIGDLASFQITPGDILAFTEGSVGWVADQPTLRLPNGTTTIFRFTAVFVNKVGKWQLAQQHVSIGVPN